MICSGNVYAYIKEIVLSTDMVNKQINQLAKKKIKDHSLRENIQTSIRSAKQSESKLSSSEGVNELIWRLGMTWGKVCFTLTHFQR